MAEYIYVEPNRSKGEGARTREPFFLELENPQGESKVLRGKVVDDHGYPLVQHFVFERELCNKVRRAIRAENGMLVIADNRLGR